LSDTDRIDLAHAPGFVLGRLTVRPETRELVRDDGATEILEPRVMQVLVALARAGGRSVTRSELSESCWEGRVVGEDAINRVLSRLRRSAEGIGEGSFKIETITKVGYRLTGAGVAGATQADPPVPRPSRRTLLIAGGAAAVAAAAGGVTYALWPNAAHAPAPTPEIAAMMESGYTNARQATGDGDLQARGIFRHVTELAPDYADGWGALAIIYANEAHYHPPAELADLTARARDALKRTRALDPDNFNAALAELVLLPLNSWLETERGLRALLPRNPDDAFLLVTLARTLARVGRFAEAAQLSAHSVEVTPASPIAMFDLMNWQWAAGQRDEADRTIERAMAMFPRNFAVWFGSFYNRLFSGRIDEAIAQAERVDGRPATVPDSEIENAIAVAQALKSREPAAVAKARADLIARAHLATGYAENAIQHLSAFGLADDAMAVAEAYFLGRGYEVPSIRFPKGQNSYTLPADRRTWFLFFPVAAPLRAHPRFDALLRNVGLKRYWQESGSKPDYLK